MTDERPDLPVVEDCPKEIIEVRRRDDGTLDEIVAINCFVHLEQMNDTHYWLGITKDDYRQVAWIGVGADGKLVASSEMDDWPDPSFTYTAGQALFEIEHPFHQMDTPKWADATAEAKADYETKARNVLELADSIRSLIRSSPATTA